VFTFLQHTDPQANQVRGTEFLEGNSNLGSAIRVGPVIDFLIRPVSTIWAEACCEFVNPVLQRSKGVSRELGRRLTLKRYFSPASCDSCNEVFCSTFWGLLSGALHQQKMPAMDYRRLRKTA
jgi:hypothetical protein